MAQQINVSRYIAEVKKNLNIVIADDIIEKDLLLTLLLAEFEKQGLGKELIFKGGTLLSRNYLQYHRFSEDLDFIYKDAGKLREIGRNARERKIKQFMDAFVPELKKAADTLGLEFSSNRSDTKFCTILRGRALYIFRMYYTENRFIKIEINFIEKMINQPKEVVINAITDFFDAKELLFTLGLKIENFKVLSYPLEEIIVEKYRAILTRNMLKERDVFDLFLIEGSLNVEIKGVIEKIRNSSLIKREIRKTIVEKLDLLKKGIFFKSDEKIEDLAIVKYNLKEFETFKERIKPILIKICELYLTEQEEPENLKDNKK